jgi:hypothetical protein
MKRTVVARITPGAAYRYHGPRVIKEGGSARVEDVEGDLYRVDGFALDAKERRELVIYTGLDGADAGYAFVCSLWDFGVKFRPEPANAGQSEGDAPGDGDGPPSEKVAGRSMGPPPGSAQ